MDQAYARGEGSGRFLTPSGPKFFGKKAIFLVDPPPRSSQRYESRGTLDSAVWRISVHHRHTYDECQSAVSDSIGEADYAK